MSTNQSASFMIRFTQKIFDNEDGKPDVQWRGKISHVQSGENKGFVDFAKAVDFMQEKLEFITASTISDKTEEEQDGILSKSFDLLKKIKDNAPKLVMDTIKDPMGQVSNIKDQIEEQIKDVGDEISQKIEIDNLRMVSKSDYKDMVAIMQKMSTQIEQLSQKVDALEKK
ncbi:MAG: hypothetical protein P1U56_25225 [Saprospiraceae bacterium]|nr:hypothetical protein [Saprospiraceae bacterium]